MSLDGKDGKTPKKELEKQEAALMKGLFSE